MDGPITSHSKQNSPTTARDESDIIWSMTRGFTIAMVVSLMLTMMMVTPAAATSGATDVTESDSQFCDNAIMTTINGAISFFTVAGPMLGSLNAVWNMSKAASTNQSSKKKEAKQQMQDSLKYGFGAGALTAIVGLITAWGPFAVCGGAF